MTFFFCTKLKGQPRMTLEMCAARPCSKRCLIYRRRKEAVERGDAEQEREAKGMKKIMEMI